MIEGWRRNEIRRRIEGISRPSYSTLELQPSPPGADYTMSKLLVLSPPSCSTVGTTGKHG